MGHIFPVLLRLQVHRFHASVPTVTIPRRLGASDTTEPWLRASQACEVTGFEGFQALREVVLLGENRV